MGEFNNIMFCGFADNRVPEFKEVKSKDWILFGEDNKFPDHLLYLFNKSSNHNAIINGKVTYIFGNGFQDDQIINSNKETVNKVFKKFTTDIELFGGGRFEVIWKMGGSLEIYHLPFQKLRRGKEGTGFWYSKDWCKASQSGYTPIFIPDFDIKNPTGKQVFAYNEYRPGCDVYPLPSYFGALNDIETDVEISKYNLSVIKNGMFSSKMIIFKNGTPTDDVKRKIERDIKEKFAGSTNAGTFWLAFQKQGEEAPEVIDLSSTDLDKLFDQLNKTTQAEIFSGHQITSPMLFGIMEPGKLGGRNELQDAYEIFKNTYINEKQKAVEATAAILFPLAGIQGSTEIQPAEPIALALDPVDFKDLLPREWILEKIGIDPTKYPSAQIPQANPLTPPAPTNENIKNLSGKQNQGLMRIIRQYGQGKLTRVQAETLLRSSLALNDDEIFSLLGEEKFEMDFSEDQVAMMFSEIGEPKSEFHIVKSAKFDTETFADVSQVDSDIINMINKDKRISPKDLAVAVKSTPDYVNKRIKELTEEGVLTQKSVKIGVDKIIETSVNPERIDYRPKPETVNVYVKYSYEVRTGGPEIIETTRPFCKRLIELNRLYTRSEIEQLSARLGYSVFDRAGGWWGDSYQCRHEWRRNLVIKKNR